MSSVIPRWQSHVHTVIARQTLGLRLLDLGPSRLRGESEDRLHVDNLFTGRRTTLLSKYHQIISGRCLPFSMPSSIHGIATAAKFVRSIYEALGDTMGASYDYQCLIMELLSFEQALKIVDLVVTLAPPTGRDALDIGAETTTCLELLKTFDDRIRSYQNILDEEGASWRRIGWSLFKADEVAIFRQKISKHKQNITLFLNGLTM